VFFCDFFVCLVGFGSFFFLFRGGGGGVEQIVEILSRVICVTIIIYIAFLVWCFFSGADIVLKSLFVFLFFCLNVCVNEEDNEVAPVVHCF
jgi:hypothetical protein